MVQFGNQLAAVPDGFITMLLQTADSETGLHTAHHQLLKAGDGVELTAGPLANLRGILKARDGTARAIVLLNILGTVAEVAVPVERLRRAS